MTKAPTTTRPTSRPALPTPAEEEPLLEITTSQEEPVEEERRPLFVIDGEVFTVPKVIDERLTFLAMNYMRTEGSTFGAMYLTELILGKPQYTRLISLYEDQKVKQPEFDQIVGLVTGLFFKKINGEDADTGGKASAAS